MKLKGISLEKVLPFLLGVSIPISPAVFYLFLGLSIIYLVTQWNWTTIKQSLSSSIVWLPVVLFVMLAVSLCFHYTPAGEEILGKYKKLLFILPLTAFFALRKASAKDFLSGFLFCNFIILILSSLSGMFHLFTGWMDPTDPTVFKKHITQNFFMAMAAVIWATYALTKSGKEKIFYLLVTALAFCNILFMVGGRTGYLALAVGLGFALYKVFPKKYILPTGIAVALLAALFFFVPNEGAQRMLQGYQEVGRCIDGGVQNISGAQCQSSMGLRTSFWIESIELIKASPWIGHGVGGFHYTNVADGLKINNPHNEYFITAVQLGLVGLVILLVWLYQLLHHKNSDTQQRGFLQMIVFNYLVCFLLNSFILDSSEGYFFIAIAAIIAARRYLENKSPESQH